MNWEDLKIVLSISRHPKLETAAQQLNLDATTISRRLKRLENRLGVTLFERTRRGHILTPHGHTVISKAEAIETIAYEMSSQSMENEAKFGRVRIGAPEGLGTNVIAPSLATFRELYPKIDVDLIAISGFVSVPKREADLSILLTRPNAGRLKVRKLSPYSLSLYASQTYLKCQPNIQSLRELENHCLVGYADDLIYSSELRYFDELLPGVSANLCSPSIVAQMEMVAANAGIGILPNFMATRQPHLVPVLPDQTTIHRTFWLVSHQDTAGLARIRAMSDFLKSSVRLS